MADRFDTIVVGLGAMGSAAAYQLARRGKRVLGLDRFEPPHSFGSSHGKTRIIREAYFEHPLYVPLIQRAYELWAELERETGRSLLRQTGGLMIGRPDSAVVAGARRSAEEHRLRHEILAAAEVRRRFPALQPADEMIAVWEPRAGILFPEACVDAHLTLARKHGAGVRVDEPALRWEPDGAGVRVLTAKDEFTADQLLLTAGSWIPALLPDLKLPLVVERQVQFWFRPTAPEWFQPDRCPIHIWECEPGRHFYGFPDLGEGVKVAGHHEGEVVNPDTIRRDVSPREVEDMRRVVRRFLPGADGELCSAVVCMYTNTPDQHFHIDWHPAHPQVLVASPCSGHGFKFSSAIGEVLAGLLTGAPCGFDLGLFRHRW
ncbi:MAG TPA: N-methyl-L-tryptophan oxidase [Candidatus Angelobacter sp.]|nr:N-methyl-L-tryptophan oxidase [Candidatus Angelobacter sp.]